MTDDNQAMNRYAIQQALTHMGGFAWPILLMATALISAYVELHYGAISGKLPMYFAVPLMAAITYMCYTPLHEAVHGNISGNRNGLKWLNDACGYLAAQVVLIPYSAHKVEHLVHHRYTNMPGRDPDIMLSRLGSGLVGSVKAVLQFLYMQMTYVISAPADVASIKTKSISCLELCVAFSWRIYLLLIAPEVMAGLLAGYFVGLVFTTYWFAYRPHLPYTEVGRYRNTASMMFPKWAKPIAWFWLGQHLHSVHHAFPKVPFYRYRKLFADVEPAMRAHGNEVIGIFSREMIPAPRRAKAKDDAEVVGV